VRSGSEGDTSTTVGGGGSEGDTGTTVGGSDSEGDTGTTIGESGSEGVTGAKGSSENISLFRYHFNVATSP
jgi:hypothetical protein